jgi:hypothetical protein
MAVSSSVVRQRQFAADLKKEYFEAESEMLRILDDLDCECQAAPASDQIEIEELARDCGRLLHRWQRSSQIGVETASQLLNDLDVLEAEKRNLEGILAHRQDALASAFEVNRYMNQTGMELSKELAHAHNRY